jgi:uncharacterized membrane protein
MLHTLRLAVTLLLVGAVVGSYFLAYYNVNGADALPIRVIVSLPAIVFIPGYLIVRTVYSKETSTTETFVLSIGFSLSIIGVWSVLLDEAGLPVTGYLVGLPTLITTLAFGVLAIWKESKNG